MRNRTLLITILGLAVSTTAFADPRHEERKREERREERREDRREERHQERREERREEHREAVRDHRAHMAPPAARFERHAERRGYLWIPGNYEWRNDNYVWVGGRYEAERRGYRWREPRWESRDGAYIRVEGDWAAMGPTAAPPALREERWEARHGFLYIRGRWDWRGDQWAWTPGHYERERVGHVWREPRWESQGGVYVQVGGTWE